MSCNNNCIETTYSGCIKYGGDDLVHNGTTVAETGEWIDDVLQAILTYAAENPLATTTTTSETEVTVNLGCLATPMSVGFTYSTSPIESGLQFGWDLSSAVDLFTTTPLITIKSSDISYIIPSFTAGAITIAPDDIPMDIHFTLQGVIDGKSVLLHETINLSGNLAVTNGTGTLSSTGSGLVTMSLNQVVQTIINEICLLKQNS